MGRYGYDDGCRDMHPYPIPQSVVANYGFGTHTVLFSDGSEYRTNNMRDAGTRFGCCYLQTDGTNHRVRAGCDHKVLMRREATDPIEQQCSGLCGSFKSALWAAVALNFVLGLLHTICAALGFIAAEAAAGRVVRGNRPHNSRIGACAWARA